MADTVCDVCIIGSGAGGAPAAALLARSGLKVAIIERGPQLDDRKLRKDELDVCRMPLFRPDEMRGAREIIYGSAAPLRANHLWTAACVGGGTRIMSGFFFRMQKEDFTPRTVFGAPAGSTHRDWPLTIADLSPWYDTVERDMGISGSLYGAASGLAGSAPLKEHPVSGVIDSACSRLGVKAIVTPRAVLAKDIGNRGPCSYSGFCGSYPCLTGAKASTHVTYIRSAQETGNLLLLTDKFVYRLESDGDRVIRAHFFGPGGTTGSVKAATFIVACGAIESARLLLNSRSAQHRSGLANRSGQVGKNLTFTMPCEVTGFFSKDKFPAANSGDSPFVQRSIQQFHRLEHEALEYRRGGTVVLLFPHPNPIQRMISLSWSGGRRVWGEALKERARAYFSYHHLISDTFIEYLPSSATFVTLSHTVRDFWGIPAAHVHVQPHPENIRAGQIMAEKISTLFREMGAAGSEYTANPFTAGELQQGTCRFGDDTADSVLDRFCRSHDIKNLFVTDGSFMPSGLPIPSTFTIMANALRVAEHIRSRG
ncbi:MAG: GMC family oxidoreductase [Chitinispirillaceae bacterium]|jgi:choline dehydrogenase-like flavoprotein|nr:GMC family oxidoreductase [Chitinispirillaceae bacterium]